MRRFLALSLLSLVGAVGASVSFSAPVERTARGYVNLPAAGPAAREPLPYRVPAAMPDQMQALSPAETQLTGYLGQRVMKNARERLPNVDPAPLLAGFQKRPGSHPWIGEHVGKWLHASTLAWANDGDPALRKKLDQVASALIKTQEADGYLGTYSPDKRFQLARDADWDVWVHKYDLIGLLTYYQYTRNAEALASCRKVGDLLCNTFGPGKKSILSAGTHVGMAATSVLEPVVLLYRYTGERRYLDFAKYIVQSWDEPKGPRVLHTLLTEKSVAKTANGKAYEMLSNLVGLCELARVTGDRQYLDAARNAWDDVVRHQLYLTGTASSHEHFHADYELPNQMNANVGETCVTVTWIQLNQQLLRLTGDARYGNELERSYYNHLSAAQRPDGKEWCYYTSLEGTKPYGPGINCCVSSGPRGMALAPTLAYLKFQGRDREGLAVNFFETSTVHTRLNGRDVSVSQTSGFPYRGETTLKLSLDRPTRFPIRVRAPEWAGPLKIDAGREAGQETRAEEGWCVIPARGWKNGDTVRIRFAIPARIVMGEHGNQGRAALTWGPIVLAYDNQRNPGLPGGNRVGLAGGTGAPVRLVSAPGAPLEFTTSVRAPGSDRPATAHLVPFAEAGAAGSRYQVWLRAPGVELTRNASLLADGVESRSREGNASGSILDGDPGTYAVTFDQRPRAEDWFAVTLDRPASVRRVVFTQGKTFHDGGWFDVSGGAPRVQVQREKGGAWETVGTLSDYPKTTATSAGGLRQGQKFTVRLAAPVQVLAVRVVGKPACGDNPAQAFASCGELEAFPE